uniref:Uncharacterized protein n=1 Tax=Amphimedon queenslandica TaxID=400682 RepID=A0A1X7VGX2_AMPQE
VPLGIEFKNAKKIDEILHNINNLHKYIPAVQVVCKASLPNCDTFEYNDTNIWKIYWLHELELQHISEMIMTLLVTNFTALYQLSKIGMLELLSSKLSGSNYTQHGLLLTEEPFFNLEVYYIELMYQCCRRFSEVVLVGHVIAAAEKVYVEGMTINEVSEIIINRFVKLKAKV